MKTPPQSPHYLNLLDLYRTFPYEWDLQTDAMQWALSARHLLGDLVACASGDQYMERLSLTSFQSRLEKLAHAAQTDSLFQMSYTLTGNDQTVYSLLERGLVMRDKKGLPTKVQGHLSLVSSLQAPAPDKDDDDDYDLITALPTKRQLEALFLNTAAAKNAYSPPTVYLKLMLEHLGILAARYGWPTIEEIIKDVSARIRSQIRADDMLIRVAGNCFGLIINECAQDDMAMVAKRLVDLIEAADYPFLKGKETLHISIGGTLFNLHSQANIRAILDEAEIALFDMQNIKHLNIPSIDQDYRRKDKIPHVAKRLRKTARERKHVNRQ